MKRIAVSILLALFAFVYSFGQGCLPEGITFTTQAEIDSFPINYPGCNEIEGSVTIGTSDYLTPTDIANLEGLSVVTHIGGNLAIWKNYSLFSLTGLENLASVDGTVGIGMGGNMFVPWLGNVLMSLEGLNGLTTVGNDLYIAYQGALSDLTGLDNLVSIGGSLRVYGNYNLVSLTGIESLISIGGDIQVGGYTGSWMTSKGNPSLVSLEGLNNISACNGILIVAENDTLISLEGLQNILTSGEVIIGRNKSLEGLSGLAGLESIEGTLRVEWNELLTNLSGLENLESVGGTLIIETNDNLTSLYGLEGLISIGGLDINQNDALADISSLSGLTAMSGSLIIWHNDELSTCHIESICNYLIAPGSYVNIHNNAPGCNSIEEVEEACDSITSIKDHQSISFNIHPNPTHNGSITLTLDNPHNLHLTCFNTFGQQIHQQEITNSETVINVSNWSPGIYLAVVYENGKPVGRSKFVVRR